jgi:hypothetical protein
VKAVGECGCEPDDAAILVVKGVEVYVDIYWEDCPSCEAPAFVQFNTDESVIKDAKEAGVKTLTVPSKPESEGMWSFSRFILRDVGDGTQEARI